MQLSMTVLRCPDQVAPEARTVSGGEFHVGRGPDVGHHQPVPPQRRYQSIGDIEIVFDQQNSHRAAHAAIVGQETLICVRSW